MFRNNRSNKIQRLISMGMLHQMADDDQGGGGSGEPEKISMTKEELDAKIAEATKPYEGIKTKNQELLNTIKTNKEALSKIDGLDVDSLLSLKDKIENDEILSLLASGKSSEALEKHTERLQLNHNAELKSVTEKLTAAEQASATDRQQLHGLLIDGEAMKAFVSAKGRETAVPDVILRAKQIFKVERDEKTGENIVAARDAKGDLIQGEKGNLTFQEWAEGLKETAPHLFPDSESGFGKGGGPNSDGKGGDAEMLAAAAKGPQFLREYKEKVRAAKASKRS